MFTLQIKLKVIKVINEIIVLTYRQNHKPEVNLLIFTQSTEYTP